MAPARPVKLTGLLTILLLAQLMAILDASIVNVAGASIRRDLGTGGPGLQLVIAGYLISYSVLLITGSRIGARFGARRVFLIGLAGFTLASLACGLAVTTAELVAFRLVQGATAALMIPQVFSIIQRRFAGEARARAIGRYGAVIAGGIVAGQILGGVLVSADLFGAQWRPVFWVNVPVGAVLLAFGVRLLPRDAPDPTRRLDLPGLLTLALAVLAFVLPLVFGHEEGWPAWCWISLVGSALLFTGFAAVQRRSAAPLMPGRLFRVAGLVAAIGALFLMMMSYGGYSFAVALHLQTALHYSPLRAGLTFVPMALSFAVASLNWRRLPASWHRPMIPVGLLVAAASLVVIAGSMHTGAGPGLVFFAAQIPFGLSSGLAYSPSVTRALAGVQPADAADASGLVTTVVQLAQVVGVAGLGSVYLGLLPDHGSGAAVATTILVGAVAAIVAAGCALLLPRAR